MMATRNIGLLSVVGVCIPTGILILLSLNATGGAWEYALDDVYIHLAMSEQVAAGKYGVNPQEPASASSSILYSYLLAPFARFGFHWLVPLVIGLFSLLAAAYLWAGVLKTAVKQAPDLTIVCLVLAAFGPVFLHLPGMSLIGMEHILHVVTVLLVLLGLIRFSQTGRVGWMLAAGIVLNPIVRFEGLSISLLALLFLAVHGQWKASLALFLGMSAPLAAHFWHMTALGLDLLPNSVNAKATISGGGVGTEGTESQSRVARILINWIVALNYPSGRALIGVVLVGSFGLLAFRRNLQPVVSTIGWLAVIAAAAHVSFGSVAPFERYEVYVWTLAIGAAVFVLSHLSGRFQKATGWVLVAALALGGAHFLPAAFNRMPDGSAAIAAQQKQMARFVDTHWKAPVAVNDLGHVSFQNPHYVLDLWGLASAEALEARLRGSDPQWMGRLAKKHNVKAAMIYDVWFGAAIPSDWVPVARLHLTIPIGTVAQKTVAFYATSETAVAELSSALRSFSADLPSTTTLEFTPFEENET